MSPVPENTSRSDALRGNTSLDEAALLVRIAERDLAAFETLYRGYHPRLQRFLERVTRRPGIVEEVLNDTMYVVWRKAASYNFRSKASTWIFGIAFRRALKALKRIDEPVEERPDERADDEERGPEASVAARETQRGIARALRSLSPDHRAVIELTYFEGCSCQETATIMGCPVNTVKTRMFHARRRLRELLTEDGEPRP